MPHEVIMPALGMAQDEGVLIAWLKQIGDKVAAGDGLMEVETDKATMEVEAGADGWLIEVRAEAGASVPVGNVVAVIGDEMGAAAEPPAPANGPDGAAPAPDASAGDAPVEGETVIMPALGMAQDSAVIVAWAVKPGDRVGAEDTLLEVETDKATMEVPAGFDGYVADLMAADGDEVPVGAAIAIISRDKPAAPRQTGAAKAPAAAPREAPATEAKAPEPKSTPQSAPQSALPAAPAGRVLASPKARRLARERGLDLADLVARGLGQPIHAADLDTLLPEAPAAAAQTVAQAQHVTAEVPAADFAAFADWLAAETGGPRRAAALAAFAAAALRAATGQDSIAVAVVGAHGAQARYADPDRVPLSTLAAAADDATPDLILRDLTGSAITGFRLGAATPTLSLTGHGDSLRLTFEGTLPGDAALTLIDTFAARIADPVRHIL